jgi:transcriptional pleiotropic regulator of transition state genes
MANGIIRKVDESRRINIPIEWQRQLDWGIGDAVEITVKGDTVILRKHTPGCTFCGVVEGDHVELMDKLACTDCCKRLPR